MFWISYCHQWKFRCIPMPTNTLKFIHNFHNREIRSWEVRVGIIKYVLWRTECLQNMLPSLGSLIMFDHERSYNSWWIHTEMASSQINRNISWNIGSHNIYWTIFILIINFMIDLVITIWALLWSFRNTCYKLSS